MERVGDTVNHVLDSKGWRGKVLERLAVELWPEVVGEPICHHSLAESFDKGVLKVRVRSPQWTQELHFLEPRIVARLNGRLRQPIVRKIQARVVTPRGLPKNRIKEDWEDPTFPAVPPMPRQVLDNLNDEAAQKAREIAGEIEDEEMRAMMARLIASVMRANQAREEGDQS